MKTLKLTVLIFSVFLTACNKSSVTPVNSTPTLSKLPIALVSPAATSGISGEAAEYLNHALDIMQNNSINKDKIDWATFRARILRFAANAKTPKETYPFITLALRGLKDYHSSFLEPQEVSALQSNTSPTPILPSIRLVEDKFGYVELPGYKGLNQDLINKYGTDMQTQIQEIDRQHPCGWIVDLRENTGGNMSPMLIGVGPILGEGTAGFFVNAAGDRTEWAYANGKATEGRQVLSEVVGEPYQLMNPEAPVAVLFGGITASSGEIIVLSFVGRANTRSFGSPSAGYTTSNLGFKLADGAIIVLTTAVDADRTGKVYGGPIMPDMQVKGYAKDTGTIPEEALQWLGSQPACK